MIENFKCEDGVISFDIQPFKLIEENEQTLVGSSFHNPIDKECFFKEQCYSQSNNQQDDNDQQTNSNQTPIRKTKKDSRNTQNSFRTINRSLKPYLKTKWQIKEQKFFQKQKPLNCLVIFKKQAEKERLTDVLSFLEKKFQHILSGEKQLQKKEYKIKNIIEELLTLTKQSFNQDQISETINSLKNSSQMKSHPNHSLTVQKLKQIEQSFIPIK